VTCWLTSNGCYKTTKKGPVSVGEVLARLTNVLENQGPALVAARCAQYIFLSFY